MGFTCFFHVLPKVLYHENSKMRFLSHRDNGKIFFNCDALNSNPEME